LVLGGIIPEGKAPLSGKILVDLEPGMEAFDNELWSGGLCDASMMLTNWQTIRNLVLEYSREI
jgi:hypothetical protein